MRAGFFVREPDGTVNASQSYLEFNFPDRLAAAFEHRGSFTGRPTPDRRPDRRPERSPDRAPDASVVQRTAEPPAPPAQDLPLRSETPVPSSSTMTSLFGEPPPETKAAGKKWLWLVAALIVLGALAVAGARYFSFGPGNETIALSVLERDGQLDIEWNHAATPVSKAVRGALEIVDGPDRKSVV